MKNSSNTLPDLAYLNLDRAKAILFQLSPAELIEAA